MNEVGIQPEIEKEVIIGPSEVEQEGAGLSLQNDPVQTNDTTKIVKEVVVIDISMESEVINITFYFHFSQFKI